MLNIFNRKERSKEGQNVRIIQKKKKKRNESA